MGSVKISTNRREMYYEQEYPLFHELGVKKFLESYADICDKRAKGDLDASIILLDFQATLHQAPLSQREREVVYWRYERDLTEKETARVLGISKTSVKSYTQRACLKLADVFAVTEGYKNVQQ
ncbi:sigma factor-like helix-turn-helix DNA-binding protein [Bacillus cereus group sp. BceL300]|uniref:sigma factor-like helix-turn-helix DNA-binding protein n=1 Tax=Bacillus cereus group TaxID=86661 RepID=UPI001443C198|nr:sigma factor-like helix-turn-helix DNA-binding protein [Bacillus cereus]MDK7480988.1 LuxR C-terminal-related transcriptional regulator [Bacillus cereus]NKW77410.1 hypothetical protein [Bacillus cereus]NKX14828.1 hypothetical protein [Bacillus cereus]HDR8003445.1 sigma-70 region 4 domain-containing protein [Bacillus cereus]HDR8014992.1 sigma-70 region 4 domain-containing protein [Bacillus cereus]